MHLLPRPNHLRKTRDVLTLTPRTDIVTDAPARAAADLLAGQLRRATGWKVPVRRSGRRVIAAERQGLPGPQIHPGTMGLGGNRSLGLL